MDDDFSPVLLIVMPNGVEFYFLLEVYFLVTVRIILFLSESLAHDHAVHSCLESFSGWIFNKTSFASHHFDAIDLLFVDLLCSHSVQQQPQQPLQCFKRPLVQHFPVRNSVLVELASKQLSACRRLDDVFEDIVLGAGELSDVPDVLEDVRDLFGFLHQNRIYFNLTP